MYRYSADNSFVYTAQDIALFRESPFASWMERLTLENPAHGIKPDAHGKSSGEPAESARRSLDGLDRCGVAPVPWQDFTRLERPSGAARSQAASPASAWGSNAVVIEANAGESSRRAATMKAMRSGAEFIVQAQLALGPLADSVKLLMRSTGTSDLGDYLYLPCDSQCEAVADTLFSLSYAADLLHGIQGRLPPQMLIFRDGMEMEALETEEHIRHYTAVKQRFMSEQAAFRKHRMPDPGDSAHFGRWSGCANEVLKRRALIAEGRTVARLADENSEEVGNAEQLRDASDSTQAVVGSPIIVNRARVGGGALATGVALQATAVGVDSDDILAPSDPAESYAGHPALAPPQVQAVADSEEQLVEPRAERAETSLAYLLNQALERGGGDEGHTAVSSNKPEPAPFSNTLDTRAGLACYD